VSRTRKPRKTILSFAATAFLGLCISQAQASIYTPDNFLFSEDLGNAGDATEKAALESFLGPNTTLIQDYKGAVPGLQKDDAGHWYIDVAPDEPGYFVLKFGTGNSNLDNHYYFENIGELTKLVFTDANVSGLIGTGDTPKAFSHYVTYNDPDGGGGGGGGNVPEPGTLALAGLGLLATVAASRRRR
jgi:hypothetical protein